MSEGRVDDAVRSYENALRIDEESVEAIAGLAQASLRAGRTERAITLYQEAREMDPESPTLQYHAGTAYAAAQRHEEALEAFSRAVELNRAYPEPYLAIGNTLNVMGRQDDARRFLDTFQQLNGFREALSQAESMVRLNPRVAEVHYNMATALTRLGRYEDAVQAFRIATELSPRFVHAFNNLGVAYVELGMFDEARDAYQQAILLDSNYVEAYTNLAWLIARHGEDLDLALELAGKAVEIAPTAVAYETLAIVRNARGDYDGADEAMGNAARIEPENEVLQQRWEQIRQERNGS